MIYSFPDTDSKRRASVLKTLNDHYASFIQSYRISVAYEKIVCMKPYKLLSCFVYDWTFAPLKRGMDDPISPKPRKNFKKKAKVPASSQSPSRQSKSVFIKSSSAASRQSVILRSNSTEPTEVLRSPSPGPSHTNNSRSNPSFTEEDDKEFLHQSHRFAKIFCFLIKKITTKIYFSELSFEISGVDRLLLLRKKRGSGLSGEGTQTLWIQVNQNLRPKFFVDVSCLLSDRF